MRHTTTTGTYDRTDADYTDTNYQVYAVRIPYPDTEEPEIIPEPLPYSYRAMNCKSFFSSLEAKVKREYVDYFIRALSCRWCE